MSNAFALNVLSKDAVKGLRVNEQKFTEAIQDILSFGFPTQKNLLSIMSYQDITQGFAVRKVGLAIQTLGYLNKNHSFATIYMPKSSKELMEATTLIAGPQGAENLSQFQLSLKITCKRLAKFILDFQYNTVEPTINRDFDAATGFYELRPDKIQSVIRVVSVEGFSVPIALEEVNNPFDMAAASKLKLKYHALSRLFGDFAEDLTDQLVPKARLLKILKYITPAWNNLAVRDDTFWMSPLKVFSASVNILTKLGFDVNSAKFRDSLAQAL